MSDELLEVVGFDLGHGETAFALVSLAAGAQPEMLSLHGEKSQLTALARHPRHGLLVGEKALQVPGSTEFEICFKGRPGRSPHLRAVVRDFAAECYRLLVESRQLRGGAQTHVYVGCPSGWTPGERKDYEELLREAEIPLLTVVPESRAALLHAKDSGKVTMGELKQSVLVVDIGSSTTDFTLVEFGRDNQVDFGADLGAAMIDAALLELSLERTDADGRIRAVLEQHPVLRSRCEIACRQAKEEFFSHEDFYEDDQLVDGKLVRLQDVGLFEPQVSAPLVREVLERPLEALAGQSWIQTFRQQLERARDECRRADKEPAVVVMTGGASRMRFLQEACGEVFGESRRRLDTEPEFCIARGLARWGRVDQRTRRFQTAIREFCRTRIPSAIAARREQLPEALAGPLAKGLLDGVVAPAVRDWRGGVVPTLAALEGRMTESAKDWLESPAGRQVLAEACEAWFDPIQRDLGVEADRICLEYQLPGGSLSPRVPFAATLPRMPRVDGVAYVDAVGGVGAVIVACVVASLMGGGGIALLGLHGPLGLVVGFLIGLLPAKFVGDLVRDQVVKLELPLMIRKAIVSEARIREACDKARPSLEEGIRQQIAGAEDSFRQLLQSVTQQLESDLENRAAEQLVWIH